MIDFQSAVLDRSHEIPVVVDFWAPWCGPCRVLGPVIEAVAEEQSGLWELVKLNTEEQQDIAIEYSIRSIPNVKMFYKGEVVSEFLGALPKKSIEQWLTENLPNELKEDLTHLLSAIDAGEKDLDHLKTFVADNPEIEAARIELAKKLVFHDPKTASQLVSSFKMGHESFQTIEAIRNLHDFQETEFDATLEVGQLLQAVKAHLQTNDQEQAIHKIIEAVSKDKTFMDDLPRKVGISLFLLLGQKHTLTKEYRWRFDMAIY